ncbi:MAG: protein translocase subunit SecD, partial [Syntrophobacterales bacterium CG_4_9_14_3_um_filter_49_8]
MFKSIRIRSIVAIVALLVSLYYLTPSLVSDLPSVWKNYLPKDKIHLGLDLRGGMHLALEVDTEKAVEATLERTSNELKETMMENKVRFRQLERTKGNIILELPDSASRSGLEKILKDNYPDLEIASGETVEGRERVTLTIKDIRVAEIEKLAVEQSLETIRNRVDQFGISEPEIIPEGDDRIIIQLPGIRDTTRAKSLIGKTALLEFKLVDEEHSPEEALRGNLPEGSVIAEGYRLDSETGRKTTVPYLLRNKTLMTGSSIESAQVKISDRFGEPYISLKFDTQGAKD